MYFPSQAGQDATMVATLVFVVLVGLLADRLSALQRAGLWATAVSCTTIAGLIAMRGDDFLDVQVLGTGVGAAALVTDVAGVATRWIARWVDAELRLRLWRRWLIGWLGIFIVRLSWQLVGDGWSFDNCLGVFVPYPHQSFVEAVKGSYEWALGFVIVFLGPPFLAAALMGRLASADRRAGRGNSCRAPALQSRH
jgi:hypothetical protein